MSSSEDEFEKEMELELDATMKRHERQFVVGGKDSVDLIRDRIYTYMLFHHPLLKDV